MGIFRGFTNLFNSRQTTAVAPSGPESTSAFEAEIIISALTDPGLSRIGNEDTVSFRRPVDQVLFITHGVLAVVADGMGGCSGGEIASQCACRSVQNAYFESKLPAREALLSAFEFANAEVFKIALEQPELQGMGTTCIALAIVKDCAYMAYVGDSRLYLLRELQLYRMTEDHSVVFELVNQGLLTREQAHEHPDRNVLSRALGTKPKVQVSAWEMPFRVKLHDRLLLCSDGLHDVLSDEELTNLLSQGTAVETSTALIAAANERGGPDNISAVVVDVAVGSRMPRVAGLTREVQTT